MVDSAQGCGKVGWSWARVESYLGLLFPLGLSAKFQLKGGAYYCYCAYVLRISRYSSFPIGDAFKYSDIFARFKTIRRK